MSMIAFFHPDRGYWEIPENAPQKFIDAYPEGTQRTSRRPGPDYDLVDGKWVRTVKEVTEDEVRAECARRLRLLEGLYTDEERETWRTQEDEARALLADPEASTPMIDRILIDGETREELAAAIIHKSDLLRVASAEIIGYQRRLLAMDPIPHTYRQDNHWGRGSSSVE